jgi:hypothetical protein
LSTRGSACLVLAPLPEEVLKQIAETASPFAKPEVADIEIAEVRAFEPTAGARPGLKGAMTELIILLPEFRVAEDVIGLRDLLEPAFSLLIPWIQIGMVLTRQSTIGLLELLVGGGALDPQDLIIITLRS